MALLTFTPPIPPIPGTMISFKPKLLKAEFGDGYTQVTRDGMNWIRRSITLQWEALQVAQAGAIVNFMSTQGGDRPFYYTPSDDGTGTVQPVKWTCEEWDDKRGRGGLRDVSCKFMESFTLET